MIIIMAWWQVGHGKSSSTATNLYNTIVTNSNPNWQWLTVGSKWSHSLYTDIYRLLWSLNSD